jgi:putative endonuclease
MIIFRKRSKTFLNFERRDAGVVERGGLAAKRSLRGPRSGHFVKNRCSLCVFFIIIFDIMFYAYILKSLKDQTHYYGSTSDLEKRVSEHNRGKSKYTKSKRPWTLHYYELFETKIEAGKREKFLKSIDGYLWLKQNKII